MKVTFWVVGVLFILFSFTTNNNFAGSILSGISTICAVICFVGGAILNKMDELISNNTEINKSVESTSKP